jgi:uncharacterized protein YcbX
MLSVSELFIYPIKSLGGIAVNSAEITDRGLKYDRRWMLVDSYNSFLTQREYPQMALLQVQLAENGINVIHKLNRDSIDIPFTTGSSVTATVQVWSDKCKAHYVSPEVDEWFSEILSINCRLVYMPDSTTRRVDSRYALNKEITNFSDGYPFLIIGQSSLDDLNNRLPEPIPINRFRPNIVFTGGHAYQEDQLKHFVINGVDFYGVKRSARCVIPTINQDTAVMGKEPLKTLSTYRVRNNNTYFGMNLLHQGSGSIHIGDSIIIHEQAD